MEPPSRSLLGEAIWTAASLVLLGVLGGGIICEPALLGLSLLGAVVVFLVVSRPMMGFWMVVALTPIESIGPVAFKATKLCKLALAALTACGLVIASVKRNSFGRESFCGDVADCHGAVSEGDRDGGGIAPDGLRLPWLLLAGSGFLASLLANSPWTSLAGLGSLLVFLFLYQAVRRAPCEAETAGGVLRTVCVVAVFVSALAVGQAFCGYGGLLGSNEQRSVEAEGLESTLWPGIERASSTLNGPTAAGAFLALAAVIAAAHAMVTSKRRTLYLLGALACAAGVLATFSRGAILGCLCGITFAGLALGRLRWRRLALMMLPLALAAAGLLSDESVRGYLRIGVDLASVSPSRFDAWSAAFAMIPQHPLFGIGFYQFQEMSQGLEGFSDTPVHPHNGFLKALVEQGPLGAAGYLLFAGTFLRRSWKSIRAPSSPAHRWILAAIGGVGVSLFAQELFDASLVMGGSSIALLFACLLAMQGSLIGGHAR